MYFIWAQDVSSVSKFIKTLRNISTRFYWFILVLVVFYISVRHAIIHLRGKKIKKRKKCFKSPLNIRNNFIFKSKALVLIHVYCYHINEMTCQCEKTHFEWLIHDYKTFTKVRVNIVILCLSFPFPPKLKHSHWDINLYESILFRGNLQRKLDRNMMKIHL